MKDVQPKGNHIELPEVFLAAILTASPNQMDPFYVTLQVNDKLIKNYMIDSSASTNIMPFKIMKEIRLQAIQTYGKCFSMDSREVPIVGVVNEVPFRLVTFLEKNYVECNYW